MLTHPLSQSVKKTNIYCVYQSTGTVLREAENWNRGQILPYVQLGAEIYETNKNRKVFKSLVLQLKEKKDSEGTKESTVSSSWEAQEMLRR